MFEIAMGFMRSSVLLASQRHNHVVVSNYIEENNCLSHLRFYADIMKFYFGLEKAVLCNRSSYISARE